MKIQTYSVIVGTTACNAKCPFCVSKMTPKLGVDTKREINWRNFKKGCQLAKDNGVSTLMLTGKGEPLLYPDEITQFLQHQAEFNFPFIEIQTNGIAIGQNPEKFRHYLKEWFDLGLTTFAISVVSFDDLTNKNNYQPDGKYMELKSLIDLLHDYKYTVRLSVIMHKEGIDSAKKAAEMINFVKENNVEQLSLRELAVAKEGEDKGVVEWTDAHLLSDSQTREIKEYVRDKGNELMRLCHSAVIYDVDGQNVCLTNALTLEPESEEIRQLIFFPDGHLRFDWQYAGATLI